MNIRRYSSMRVYSFGNSYILSSDYIKDEKLEIRVIKNSLCINILTSNEWDQIVDSQTNSILSPSAANVFTGCGCLGLLSTSNDQARPNDKSASIQHYLIFVKDAQSVGTYRSFEFLKITDIFVLPVFEDSSYYSTTSNFAASNSEFINDLK